MKNSIQHAALSKAQIFAAILLTFKRQEKIDEQVFVRLNSILSQRIDETFGNSANTKLSEGAYATYLAITESKNNTAQVVKQAEASYLSVDFLTTLFTLKSYVRFLHNRINSDFDQDWRFLCTQTGNEMVEALNILADDSSLHESLLEWDAADTIAELKRTILSLLHPTSLRRVVEEHGDKGFNIGTVIKTVQECIDELESLLSR